MGSPPVLLLDLDQTLVDLRSAADYGAAVRDLDDLSTGWPDVPRPRRDLSPADAADAFLARLVGDERWVAASAAVEFHERRALGTAVAVPLLDEVVAAWGSARVAVLTSVSEPVAAEVLARHGVRVAAVVGRSPALRPTPAQDLVVAACARLGVRPRDAALVGASARDGAAARAAGVAYADAGGFGRDGGAALVAAVRAGLDAAGRPAAGDPATPAVDLTGDGAVAGV